MSEARINIAIFDTTLRDGAQSLPQDSQFPEGAKADIAEHIANLGVGVIEAGFPRTPGDGQEVRAVCKSVGNSTYSVKQWQNGRYATTIEYTPIIAGLSRTTPEDIEATWDGVESARYPRIHTFISTDSEHMRAKFPGKTPKEVLAMGQRAVRMAKDVSAGNPGSSVEFSAEAASTTDLQYLERVVKTALNEGADVINLPDTVGQRNAFWMMDFYKRAIGWVIEHHPGVAISAHNHNDMDYATANTVALVAAAASEAADRETSINVQLETSICGVGERAGNADVFPVVANIFKDGLGFPALVEWRFNPEVSVQTAKAVMSFAGVEIHRQNPIVGSDILVHRSGIHSDGVIKGGHRIYTPHDPTFWGHEVDARHEEGKYQGKRGRAAISPVH